MPQFATVFRRSFKEEEMENKCCVLRDRLRWWGVVTMLIGATVLGLIFPVGLGGVMLGLRSTGTIVGYVVFVASSIIVLGAIAAHAHRIPRTFGRRAKCAECIADGTLAQYNPWLGRHSAIRTDPDESGIRLRPDSPQEPTASKKTK